MSEPIVVIEDTSYGETRKALFVDPLITAMAVEIADAIKAGHLTRADLDEWSFTVAALRQYNERGGTVDTHIGGPAEVIRTIIDS